MNSAVLLATILPAAWTLVWKDEFDGDGPPDSSKWNYEVGFVRNKEVQFYTEDRRENARLENGHLVIEARKDGFEGKPVSSASLTTDGKESWTYGRFEVRAKFPTGKGTWPAIWFLGDNKKQVGWPRCGEIDLMENVGFDPDKIHFNIHTLAYNHMKGTNKGATIEVAKPYEGFHDYALEWFPDHLDFFFDGEKTFTYTKEEGAGDDKWPYDKPQHLILNLAIGGSWGGQQGVDESIYPAKYEVDYVRVYRKE